MFKTWSVCEEKINDEQSQRYECSSGVSAAKAYDFLTKVRSSVFAIMQEEEEKIKKIKEPEQENKDQVEE